MPDLVSVVIDGKEFGSWSEINLTLPMDSFSTVGLAAPFESSRLEFRETFRPFTFKPIEVLVDGDTLFAGTLVAIASARDANRSSAAVGGYSLPGVLQDCGGDIASFPFEFKGLGLRDIATALVEPFGLSVQFDAEEGAKFDKVKLEADRSIASFLAELAQQRNLIVGNTTDGKLLCHRSIVSGKPVARLRENAQPVVSVSNAFDPQRYFSKLTGFSLTKRGKVGSAYTAQNPFLSNVLRPKTFKVADTEDGDTPAATQAKMGRMFANACPFSAEVATWRDPQGAMWRPNTSVVLHAPDAMVYRETEFIVRSVSLHQDANKSTAALDLVLPGAFSGEIPEVLPWAE